MASPHVVGFALFSNVDGSPLTGQTPTFSTYCDETGSDILPKPPITEVKGGLYVFTPSFHANHLLCYVIDAGVNSLSRYFTDILRPESFDVDQIATAATNAASAAAAATNAATVSTIVKKIQTNRWIVASNQLIIYDDDRTTPLYTFNLFDQNGIPTMTSIFQRVPTP